MYKTACQTILDLAKAAVFRCADFNVILYLLSVDNVGYFLSD